MDSNIVGVVIFIIIIVVIAYFYWNRSYNYRPIPNKGILNRSAHLPRQQNDMSDSVIDEIVSEISQRHKDPRDFTYKKKNYTHRSQEDIADLFNVDKMLPKEKRADWFDTDPLMDAQQFKGSNLIQPKDQLGVNTIGSSKKNATHDIRGDIINPKIRVSPWGNSSIDEDTNIRGFCHYEINA